MLNEFATGMITKVFLFVEQNSFSEFVQKWCVENSVGSEIIDSKSNYLEACDGIVMFHENHNFSKEGEDLLDTFDKNNLPIHKVDINGTLVATSSNFYLWLERNKIERLLVIGGANLTENENLLRFFGKIAIS